MDSPRLLDAAPKCRAVLRQNRSTPQIGDLLLQPLDPVRLALLDGAPKCHFRLFKEASQQRQGNVRAQGQDAAPKWDRSAQRQNRHHGVVR